jgi:hypothetical protein
MHATSTFGGTGTLSGVSVNNSPTVQDPWNSTCAGTGSNHLDQVNVNGQYAYRQTYAVTLAYFDIRGNHNALLYPPGSLFGSATNSPDSRSYTLQLEWIPFGKADSFARPFLNMRLGVQYTGYTKFNGGNGNYDGAGHSARDNNTLMVFVWLAI